jgi:hypothetical protein
MTEETGTPPGLDAGTARRVARSFLLVRTVRGSLILLFLAVAILAVELKDWPRSVSASLALTMLLQAFLMVAMHRVYVRAVRAAD